VFIHDIPLVEWFLYSLPSEFAKVGFEITPEEEAALEIYLDADCYRSVMNACYSAHRKPLLSFSEVF
jgi:hypothetical protein